MGKLRIKKRRSPKKGFGGVKKSKWRRKYSPESKRRRPRDYVQKALENLATSSPKERFRNKSSRAINKVNPVQVVNYPSTKRSSIESPKEVRSSRIPQHKIPFTHTPRKIQPVSPYGLSELFKKGQYHLLDQLIMDTDSHLLIGKLDYNTIVLQEGVLRRLYNLRLLVICNIDKRRYMALYGNKTQKIYLICDVSKKNNLVLVTPYKNAKIPTSYNLDTYSAKDLEDCFLFLSCLCQYSPTNT